MGGPLQVCLDLIVEEFDKVRLLGLGRAAKPLRSDDPSKPRHHCLTHGVIGFLPCDPGPFRYLETRGEFPLLDRGYSQRWILVISNKLEMLSGITSSAISDSSSYLWNKDFRQLS